MVFESNPEVGPRAIDPVGEEADFVTGNVEFYHVAVETSQSSLVRFVVRAANEDLATETVCDWLDKCPNMDPTPPLSYSIFGHIQEPKPLTPVEEDHYRFIMSLGPNDKLGEDRIDVHFIGFEAVQSATSKPEALEQETIVNQPSFELDDERFIPKLPSKGKIPRVFQSPGNPDQWNEEAMDIFNNWQQGQIPRVSIIDFSQATRPYTTQ